MKVNLARIVRMRAARLVRMRAVRIMAGAAGVLLLLLTALFALTPFSVERLRLADDLRVFDANSAELRHFPDARGERHVWAALDDIPPLVREAFIAAEDRRFYSHPGFDPLAIARAAAGNLGAGRIESGASTITQQLVRLAYPRPRTYAAKIVEIVRAVKTEWALTKDQILEIYLNRVPLGNNILGVELGARVYFDRSPAALNAAEAALLAALPKAPSALNPRREQNRARLLGRRDWVLARMAALDYIGAQSAATETARPIAIASHRFPFAAPHLVERVAGTGRIAADIHTTLDLALQRRVEEAMRAYRYDLYNRGALQAAALVVDNRTRGVLAYAGSLEWSVRDGGYNNGVRARRSPGSLLKPLLYALALDEGYTAASLLADVEGQYPGPGGAYIPKNFDRNEYGPLTLRASLGNSLNLPAVRMLNRLGLEPFYRLLSDVSVIDARSRRAEALGLGLAIGNPEVSLEQLVAAYAALASGGEYRPLRYCIDDEAPPNGVLSPEAAFIVSDILADPTARMLTFGSGAVGDFGFRVSWKTGTSTHYRDAWIVGYTADYTIGVWAGNFDGSPTRDMSGATVPGAIFAELVRDLHRGQSPAFFAQPAGVARAGVCGRSGMKPLAACPHIRSDWFIAGTEPEEECTFHRGGDESAIPAAYAGWLYDQAQRGPSSSYRLEDLPILPAGEFDDPWKGMSDGSERASAVKMLSASLPTSASEASESDASSVAIQSSSSAIVLVGRSDDNNNSESSSAHVAIRHPLPGSRFLHDAGERTRALRLEARISGKAETVTWYVDGEEFARTGPPYRIYWPMSPGRHRVAAVAPNRSGATVEFSVD